jgi:hypothetical protein
MATPSKNEKPPTKEFPITAIPNPGNPERMVVFYVDFKWKRVTLAEMNRKFFVWSKTVETWLPRLKYISKVEKFLAMLCWVEVSLERMEKYSKKYIEVIKKAMPDTEMMDDLVALVNKKMLYKKRKGIYQYLYSLMVKYNLMGEFDAAKRESASGGDTRTSGRTRQRGRAIHLPSDSCGNEAHGRGDANHSPAARHN